MDLRSALVWGQRFEAEEALRQAGERLSQRRGVPPARELDLLCRLNDGVECVRNGDLQRGVDELLEITSAPLRDQTPHFVAWYWIARALAGLGRLEELRTSIERMIGLTAPDDDEARALCTLTLAALEVQSGRTDAAFDLLDLALGLFTKLGHRRGEAAARLSEAALMAVLGDLRESIFAAKHAQALAPEWPDPLVFQLKQGLVHEDHELLASSLMELQNHARPRLEQSVLTGLARKVLSGVVTPQLAAQATQLLDLPPTSESLEQLTILVIHCNELPELRLVLAFKLLAEGQYEEAKAYFSSLLDGPSELRTLVDGGLRLVEERLSSADSETNSPVSTNEEASGSTQADPSEGHASKPGETRTLGREEVRLVQQMDVLSNRQHLFSGDLEVLSFPDLLGFICSGRRTGELVIRSDAGIAVVCISDGQVTSAVAPCCDTIGAILVERGTLTVEQLERALEAQQKADLALMLGAVLIQRGVDQALVRSALILQAQTAVQELVNWTSGEFVFSPRSQPAGCVVELDPRHLLLDAIRLNDQVGD